MRTILLSTIFVLSVRLLTYAQTTTTKQEDIRHLMDLMGTTTLMKQSMSRSLDQFKQMNTNLPPEFWTAFEKEANYEELINRLIPVYDKHYTHEDLKGLLAFYRSPLGQKSIQELPAILQESSAIGRTWGEQLGRRIAEQIQQQNKTKN